MMKSEIGHTDIMLKLPDGSMLTAKKEEDPVYPRIGIFLQQPDGKVELICFAEHNGGDERAAGHELCIGAYISCQDEPIYYGSYAKEGETES